MTLKATDHVTNTGRLRARTTTVAGEGRSTGRFALAALLLFAGAVHLGVAPEHVEESLVLGLGFLATGIGQVALAPILLRSPPRTWLRLAAALSLFSLLALAAAVTVGLPMLPHGEAMGPLGPVEKLEDIAAFTGFAELMATIVAIWLLVRGDRPHALPGAV